MTLAFSRKAVEEAGDDWKEVSKLNTALQRLSARRKLQVDPIDEKIWPSKVAWKIETFTQVILYRLIALCAGTISTWETGHPLASILSARAVMETTAFMWDFSMKLQDLCNKNDLEGIDNLTDKRTFGVRDTEWLKSLGTKFTQINVLTVLQKMDKKLAPGLWAHYERLSEICHPNLAGHYMFFADLNYETAIVKLSNGFIQERNLFKSVIGALMLAWVHEQSIDQIENLIPFIVKLSEQVDIINGS